MPNTQRSKTVDHKTDPRVIKIKKLWDKSDLTQFDAACLLDMSQPCINQYIHGVIPMNTDTVIKFATLFNIAPSAIDPTLKI